MSKPVPLFDLSHQTRAVLTPFLRAVREIGATNRFVGGEAVEEFEQAFAAYCGVPFCVGLNSGTDGLRFALQGLGIGPEEEVVTSPFTFVATGEAALSVARLRFADVDPETFNLNPARVEDQLNSRTRVLLPVHIFGLPADLPSLLKVARRHRLKVVEDACQAHGARIEGRPVGSFGEAGVFSFYPTKNLGAFGDAGCVVTRRASLAAKIRLLRNHGQTAPYIHREVGLNSRLDALQARLLSLKLPLLEEWVEWRRRLSRIYREVLQGVEGVHFQKEPPGFRHAYHLLAARVKRRSRLMAYLRDRGVEARVIYPRPLHLQEAFASLGYRKGDFPEAERVSREVLCFPLYPGMQAQTAERIAGLVRKFYVG